MQDLLLAPSLFSWQWWGQQGAGSSISVLGDGGRQCSFHWGFCLINNPLNEKQQSFIPWKSLTPKQQRKMLTLETELRNPYLNKAPAPPISPAAGICPSHLWLSGLWLILFCCFSFPVPHLFFCCFSSCCLWERLYMATSPGLSHGVGCACLANDFGWNSLLG